MKSRRRLLRRDFWSRRLRGIHAAALCGVDFVAGEDWSERVQPTQEAERLAVNTESRAAGRPQIKKKRKNKKMKMQFFSKIIKIPLKTLKNMLLTKEQKQIVSKSRYLSRWFQIKIEIRVFGKLIWSYVWPPESTNIEKND